MERSCKSLVFPKPRRVSLHQQIRPSSWVFNHQQAEMADSIAGNELLDIILSKGGYAAERPSNIQVPSSPPYFCGSPPSRASNPLIEDAQFKEEHSPAAQLVSASRISGGGCVRTKFGAKPAAVRIEGFDCLNRDSCSVSAVA